MNLSAWGKELILEDTCIINQFFIKKKKDDEQLREFLHDGILRGFSIVDNDSVISPYDCNNYLSATQGQAKLFFDELIRKELNEFKYVRVAKQPYCVHSLGAVKKGDNEFRPITDCRRPL